MLLVKPQGPLVSLEEKNLRFFLEKTRAGRYNYVSLLNEDILRPTLCVTQSRGAASING
jgi:hypothetical protein